MSRLWSNPPLKSDGTLDYAQLTMAEICEDLTESLTDRVINGGIDELQTLLDQLPEKENLPSASPTIALVQFMEHLLGLEMNDPDFRSPEAHATIQGAIGELKGFGKED